MINPWGKPGAQGQHPHKKEPDGSIRGQSRLLGDEGNAPDHKAGAEGRSEYSREANQNGNGDTGQNSVTQRITDEGQSSQDNKSTSHGTGNGDQNPGN